MPRDLDDQRSPVVFAFQSGSLLVPVSEYSRTKLFFCYLLSFATPLLGFVLPAVWASLLSCAVLIGLAYFVAGRRWKSFTGLKFTQSSVFWFAGLFAAASALVWCVVVLGQDGAKAVSVRWQSGWLLILVTVLMQSFAEEVLFRTYLIGHLPAKVLSRPRAVIVLSGCVFSLAHLINYRAAEGVFLSWAPLLALFLLGTSGTRLFLRQGHLLGAWGFHAGWNFVRFSFEFSSHGQQVAESVTFELIEGSLAGLFIACLWAVAAVFHPAAKASR